MERVKAGTSTAKGKKVAINDFVKEALSLNRKFSVLRNHDSAPQDSLVNEKALLDGQWDDKGDHNQQAGDCIAMVDVSGSMCDDDSYPLRTAIGLGIRIAEKSRLGNRVMTFAASGQLG